MPSVPSHFRRGAAPSREVLPLGSERATPVVGFVSDARRLTRDGADVRMASRHVDLLCLLAAHAGQVVPKETLIAGVWHDVAVTTGSLDQGLFALRQTLPMPSGQPLIEIRRNNGMPQHEVASNELNHHADE